MEKWEQAMMKHVNRPLPEAIDDRVGLTLVKLKRKRSRSITLRFGALISASFVVIIGMSYLSPTFAESLKSLPMVKSVFELVGGVDMRRGSELLLTTELGQEIYIKDQVVTFTESLYDGSKINLSWTVPSSDPNPWAFKENIIFTINGKRVESYGSNTSYEKLGNGNYAGTISISAEEELPKSFMLGLLSPDETITYAYIPVEQKGEYQTFEIDQLTSWNDIQVEYRALTLYPTTTELSFNLRNTDSVFWDYQVIDDQGRVLQPISVGGHDYKEENNFKAYFEPFDTPNKISIRPYFANRSGETKISGEWKGKRMTLDQGKAGSVIILDQKLENGKLTLTYEVTGYRITEQIDRIWLEDSKGLPYYRDEPPTRIRGSNLFQMTFSNVSKIDSIYIVTSKFNTHYLEDLEVSVEVK